MTNIKQINALKKKKLHSQEKKITNVFSDLNFNLILKENFLSSLFFINFLSLLLKSLIGLYGYSGEGVAPKFGDYEAQRHWMEITVNVEPKLWYTDSESNPNTYWPIDYPPLSAYYSYVWGMFFKALMPDSINLFTSRGYESIGHKILMRFSVLVSDILFFHLPVCFITYLLLLHKKNKNIHSYVNFFISNTIFLLSPIFMIIDHGHFQYNCVMHGLYLLALYFLYSEYFILAIFTYSLCLNFKQMGLYYALPFPVFVLKLLWSRMNKINFNNILILFLQILKYGIFTILSFLIIWAPWILNNTYSDVLKRIFPVWRGVFEDKVATFWCTLNIVYKFSKLPLNVQFIASTAFTLFFSLLSCLPTLIYKNPSKKLNNLSFFIVSMSFFLFSFHVHEKTILVPYIAYLLNYPYFKEIFPSFSLISLFSLYPLLTRENQEISYFILLISFYIISKYLNSFSEFKGGNKNLNLFCVLLEILNILLIISFHICEIMIKPPVSYPWLYPMINAAISFGNFGFYLLLAYYKQINIFYNKKRNKK